MFPLPIMAIFIDGLIGHCSNAFNIAAIGSMNTP